MRNILRRTISYFLVVGVCLWGGYFIARNLIYSHYDSAAINVVNAVSAQVARGGDPAKIVEPLQLPASLDRTSAVFALIYNDRGELASKADNLDGARDFPLATLSVTDTAPAYTASTWTPFDGQPVAAVAQKFYVEDETFYVVAGRSLESINQLTNYLVLLVVLVWIFGLPILALAAALGEPRLRERIKRRTHTYRPR